MKIDRNTETSARGKYAITVVEAILRKPLISKLDIEGKFQFLEYEGLPNICFGCGVYGYLRRTA